MAIHSLYPPSGSRRTRSSSTSRMRRSKSFRPLTLERLEPRAMLSAATAADSPAAYERIINGTATSDWEAVGMVGERNSGYYGSGTLIAPQYVLTAGHCGYGVGNTAGRFKIGGVEYTTTKVYVHPNYHRNQIGTDQANDIAIFKLSKAVSGVTPSSIYRNTPEVGELLTLVGYGAGGSGNTGSNGDFGTKRVGTTPIDEVTSTLILWNFENNSESNTAPGDSGGPAYLEVGGVYYVAGVCSGGDRANAAIGDHSFDTRVDAYASWIDSIVGTTATLPAVSIVATDATAAETAAGAAADTGLFTVSRTGSTTAALTVTYTISGTATNGTDYATIASSLTIPAGSASATVRIAPIDDSTVEATETVKLTLSSSSSYSVDSTKSSATVSILDNEPAVSIVATDATAAETLSGASANTGLFTITRTGSTTAALTVTYTISGTATNGTDYTTIASSLTIPAGSASATVQIAPIDDSTVESTETLTLTLASSSAYSIDSTASTATVSILDNDTAARPVNDNFANRITITAATVSGSNVNATRESGEPNHARVAGGCSVWWSWTAPSSGQVTISTAGSSFDTTLGVYTGTTLRTLKTVASNDDANRNAGIKTSLVSFSAVAGRTYQIAVDGYNRAQGSINLRVTQARSGRTASSSALAGYALPSAAQSSANTRAYDIVFGALARLATLY